MRNLEIGAYLNTLRSNLDILASVLVVRYGICVPEDACFPITKSEAVFGASVREEVRRQVTTG